MCVGGVPGEDSCGGDSGAPLMKVESQDGPPRYYLIGIVSFGAKNCGASTTPAINANVAKYITWILDRISAWMKKDTAIHSSCAENEIIVCSIKDLRVLMRFR